MDDGVEEEEYNNKAMGSDEDEDGEELSDTEIEKRRQSLRQKVLTLKEQQVKENSIKVHLCKFVFIRMRIVFHYYFAIAHNVYYCVDK